jgi:hypothetical protein
MLFRKAASIASGSPEALSPETACLSGLGQPILMDDTAQTAALFSRNSRRLNITGSSDPVLPFRFFIIILFSQNVV